MEKFMLIFRHPDASKTISPEQMEEWMKIANEWVGGLAAQKKLVSYGNGLAFDDARVVHHDGKVTNGPFGEIKETLGGYMIVQAETVEEAVKLVEGCPILLGEGNTVEVRKIGTPGGDE